MRIENKGRLVRGKLVTRCMISNENIVAVTPWYKPNDSIKCETALKMLISCYSAMPGTDGINYKYEYKD